MNTEKNNAESWAPCDPGTLSTFAQKDKTKRRNQKVTRFAGVSALIVCVVGLSVWGITGLSSYQEYYYGGIACSEVRKNMQAYAMGSLPTELKNRITDHVKQCPHCQKLMRQMNATASTGPKPSCSCAACQQFAEQTSSPQTFPTAHLQNQLSPSELLLVADVP